MLREMRPPSCFDVNCNIGRTQRGLNLDRTDLPSELDACNCVCRLADGECRA
jgi:hypothetical protein